MSNDFGVRLSVLCVLRCALRNRDIRSPLAKHGKSLLLRSISALGAVTQRDSNAVCRCRFHWSSHSMRQEYSVLNLISSGRQVARTVFCFSITPSLIALIVWLQVNFLPSQSIQRAVVNGCDRLACTVVVFGWPRWLAKFILQSSTEPNPPLLTPEKIFKNDGLHKAPLWHF